MRARKDLVRVDARLEHFTSYDAAVAFVRHVLDVLADRIAFAHIRPEPLAPGRPLPPEAAAAQQRLAALVPPRRWWRRSQDTAEPDLTTAEGRALFAAYVHHTLNAYAEAYGSPLLVDVREGVVDLNLGPEHAREIRHRAPASLEFPRTWPRT